jgi:hypothetical protein
MAGHVFGFPAKHWAQRRVTPTPRLPRTGLGVLQPMQYQVAGRPVPGRLNARSGGGWRSSRLTLPS